MKGTHTADLTQIEIVGADANNLKDINIAFPLKRISVVTGVSGSGKSSLLFGTVAAEGSRRMRIFLGQSQQEVERDDVRAFIGPLPPTILVGQRGFRPSIRTTVGTATGFLSFLRRLFILISAPYSEEAKDSVPPPSPETYTKWILKNYSGPAEVWAAPVRQQRTDGVAAVKRLASHGIKDIIVRSETDPPRLQESGRVINTAHFKGLNAGVVHTIEAFVGRVELSGSSSQPTKTLEELLDRAFLAGHGSVVVTLPDASNPDLAGPFGPRLDSVRHWVHPKASAVFFHPTAHLLSFNAPEHEESGACRACNGTGVGRRLREDALISKPNRSMRDGAFEIWTEKNYKYVNVQHETIEGLSGLHGFSPDVAWSKLPATARAVVLNGSGSEAIFDREPDGQKFGRARPFAGFRRIILDKSSAGTKIADKLSPYVEVGPCDACSGTRWSFQARSLRVADYSVADLLGMTFKEVEAVADPHGEFAKAVPSNTRSLVEAIRQHAHSIVSVGLGYLTGDRGMLDVSEGESRRIRLARVLDARERGLCLLLDEPARGLHESDLSALAHSLERMRGEHTIILNEHRERLWDIADWFVEIGPGAGLAGGEITYAGPRRKPGEHEEIPMRTSMPIPPDHPRVVIRGASINNVDNVDCDIPIGRMTCISGVSGSGKSSFVRGVLVPALCNAVGGNTPDFALRRGHWRSVKGAGPITEVVALDQMMPPANRRSLVATFTDVFDDIRKVFGTSPDAKRDGLSASDFGVNAGDGRCPICMGVGEVPDGNPWSICPSCGGSRYGHSALSVRIDGVNVQELLQMPVERLGSWVDTFRIPQRLIAGMRDLGIGHIALGRRIDTLSGGEVQRLRLAMRLGVKSPGSTVFIFDEPAVGLHPSDVGRLAGALERVLEKGRNTIVMVEHDLRLIRSADWVVDFGPGSGPDGGEIVFSGLPKDLAKARTATGLALAGKLPTQERQTTVVKSATTKRKTPADEEVVRTAALIRTLITGDAPATVASEDEPCEPVVLISEGRYEGRDRWEVAGLDLEIPKLLLDVQREANLDTDAKLLLAWKHHPDCWLAIQPFITDMQIWEQDLPRSVVNGVVSHILKEGLCLVTTTGKAAGKDFDVRQVRATGRRLVPLTDDDDSRSRVLRDAFAVGAGYVELRDGAGRCIATATNRLLNLETSVVAPMSCLPPHFSRFDFQGRCPACKGNRGVTALATALVIKDQNATPESENFLTDEANGILKGIRRNELNPFLRRLAKEGLWDTAAPFNRLAGEKQDLIRFGFWSRPGAGSFLKNAQSNPAEVSAWLRWDGLYRHLLDQLDRSPDTAWAARVRDTAKVVKCSRCEGSGLQRFASLLDVGDISFAAWTRLPIAARKVDLLMKVNSTSQRQTRTHKRILHCLDPLKHANGSVLAVIDHAVKSFTTMTTVEDKQFDQN